MGQAIEYDINGNTYEGYFAKGGANAPLVLLAHAWGGLKDNEKSKADRIASDWGYNAFAMDVYGKGQRGDTPEECTALMSPLAENREALQNRLSASLAFGKTLDGVDSDKVAAIGFCFGGLSVLDMARANMDVLGVASFHGLLGAPGNLSPSSISPKILISHGWQDPMAKPEDVVAIGEELNAANADWQLHAFGPALHSFTTEGANNSDMGTVYDADADRRSFAYLKIFLKELFG